jgi:hypothetical protein
MTMAKVFDTLRKILRGKQERSSSARPPRRNNPQFVGRSSTKEIEQAAPERIGELVGHAPERVDT